MRSVIGLGVAAAAAAAVAVSAIGAPAASTTNMVYHSKLRGGNNEILVASSAGGAPTRLTRHRASDSNHLVGGRKEDRVREQPAWQPAALRGLGPLRHEGRRQRDP